MTDQPEASLPDNGPSVIQQVPPDDLVEQTIERAAGKVAAVTVPGGPPVMNRMEALACVAVLVVLQLAVLFASLQNRGDTRAHQQDFKTMCQVFVEFAPPDKATDLARTLAECLD